MRRKFTAWIAVAACLTTTLFIRPRRAEAQFWSGWTITFDPTQALNVITEIAEIVQVYTVAMQTFMLATSAAQFFTSKGFWQGFPFLIVNSAMLYGGTPTDSWAQAVNTGLNVAQVYIMNAVALRYNPGLIFGGPFTYRYVSAQIAQAHMVAGMQTLGAVRVHQLFMQPAIQACQDSALMTDLFSNGAVAQQNISNACLALMAQQMQASIGVESQALEIQLGIEKRHADDYIDNLNQAITVQQLAINASLDPSGDGTALMNYAPH